MDEDDLTQGGEGEEVGGGISQGGREGAGRGGGGIGVM